MTNGPLTVGYMYPTIVHGPADLPTCESCLSLPDDDSHEPDDEYDLDVELAPHGRRYGFSPLQLAVGLSLLLASFGACWLLFREPDGSFDAADQATSTQVQEVGSDLEPPEAISTDGTDPTLPPAPTPTTADPNQSDSTAAAPQETVAGAHAGHGAAAGGPAAPGGTGTTPSTALDTTGWNSFSQMAIGDYSVNDPIIAEGQPGSVRFACFPSHLSYDDPIVFPNQPGKAHLHQFFGNTLTSSGSTIQSLERTGDSTCDGQQLNRSAYWIPALIDQSGNVRIPQYTQMYYKAGPMTGQKITPFPAGLQIITGDARSTSDSQNSGVYNWHCGFPGNYPTIYGEGRLIPTCNQGDALTLSLVFPQCWDGKNLDSPDHQAHMAHPQGSSCPASHPVIVPEITFNIYWTNADTSTAGWYLSSDRHGGLNLPGGTTTHGDWVGAWHPDILRTFVEDCNNQSYDCKGATISPSLRLLNSKNTGMADGQDIFNPLHAPMTRAVSSVPH